MVESLVAVLEVAFVGFYALVDQFVAFEGGLYLERAATVRVSASVPALLWFFLFADAHLDVVIFIAVHAVVLSTLGVLPLLLFLLIFDTLLMNLLKRMSNLGHKLPRIENHSLLSSPFLPSLEYITALILKKPALISLHRSVIL